MQFSDSSKKYIAPIVLGLILLFIIIMAGIGLFINFISNNYRSYNLGYDAIDSYEVKSNLGMGLASNESITSKSMPIYQEDGLNLDATERLTTENYNYNIEALDVDKTAKQLETFVLANNGIVINNNVSRRNSNVTGNLYVAVPRDSVENFKSLIENVSSKVLNSNKYGSDITEQYSDLQRMLAQLELTQTKLESIYEQATSVEDLLNVQQALIKNLGQIDEIKGRLNSSEERSKITYFSISISTDDIALPITEQKKWQPLSILKDSARDLVSGLQEFVNLLIRTIIVILPLLLVYLLPIVLVVWIIKKRKENKNNRDNLKDESK